MTVNLHFTCLTLYNFFFFYLLSPSTPALAPIPNFILTYIVHCLTLVIGPEGGGGAGWWGPPGRWRHYRAQKDLELTGCPLEKAPP